MPLTEQNVIDKIEVYEDGTVGVRTLTRVLRDGVQIAETYARETLTPGQDVSAAHPRVQAIAAAAWTPAVVSTFAAKARTPLPGRG